MTEPASILLIEDEPRLRNNLQILLEGEGYQVTVARNGVEGIKKVQEETFDLVITDVVMPEMDGFQVMEYLKAHFPEMVVVTITGYVSSQSAIDALRKGAYDYLPKPFDFDLMKITIERALEKARLQKAVKHYTSELERMVEERTSELSEANKKLEQSLAELKAAQEHLIQSEKLSALGELIAGVAHELNNPLTTIVGFAELLTKTAPLGNGTKGQLEKISGAAFRCHQIVRSLLSFARKQKPEKAYIDINALCEGVLTLLAYQLKVSNIALEKRFAEKLPRTMADPHQLQQVFINITTNAYHAMSSSRGRGKLVVETKQSDGTLHIAFRDNGPGILPEHQRKIFDPFFTTKEHGTGLGLSLSYGIIKEHEGKISLESVPGAGTTFLIELPIIAQPSQTGQPPPQGPESAAKRRILVVDDEENNLRLLLAIIRHLGHQADGVSSGQEALEKIAKQDYDVLISDIKMPNVDGQRLYQQVRTLRPELAHQIIFTSGDIVSGETQAFLDRVQCPFVMKPFRIADIEAIIRQTVTPASHASPSRQPGGREAGE